MSLVVALFLVSFFSLGGSIHVETSSPHVSRAVPQALQPDGCSVPSPELQRGADAGRYQALSPCPASSRCKASPPQGAASCSLHAPDTGTCLCRSRAAGASDAD